MPSTTLPSKGAANVRAVLPVGAKVAAIMPKSIGDRDTKAVIESYDRRRSAAKKGGRPKLPDHLVKAATLRKRRERAAKTAPEKKFDSCYTEFCKGSCPRSEADTIRWQEAAIAQGAVPQHHDVFELRPLPKVMVLWRCDKGKEPVWIKTNIFGIRRMRRNNSKCETRRVCSLYGREYLYGSSLVAVIRPREEIGRRDADLRRSEVVCVEDRRVIPVAFFGKTFLKVMRMRIALNKRDGIAGVLPKGLSYSKETLQIKMAKQWEWKAQQYGVKPRAKDLEGRRSTKYDTDNFEYLWRYDRATKTHKGYVLNHKSPVTMRSVPWDDD